jgi:hypothetical protein
MHKGALAVMIAGGVMAAIGMIALELGESGFKDIGGDWVGERNDWEGQPDREPSWFDNPNVTGVEYTHEYEGERNDMMFVFAKSGDDLPQPTYDCSEFDLNVTMVGDNDSRVGYANDPCTFDGKLPAGFEDDPDGYLHYGYLKGLKPGETYIINTTCEENETRNYNGEADQRGCDPYIYLVSQEEIERVIGSFARGLFGYGSGYGCLCCGLLTGIIGLIMMLTMKEEVVVKVTYDSEGRVIVQDTGYLQSHSQVGGEASPSEAQESWEAGLASKSEANEGSAPDDVAEGAGEWWDEEKS